MTIAILAVLCILVALIALVLYNISHQNDAMDCIKDIVRENRGNTTRLTHKQDELNHTILNRMREQRTTEAEVEIDVDFDSL